MIVKKRFYLLIITFFLGFTMHGATKQYDATLSFIMYAPEQHDEEAKIAQELRRNFTTVQPFDLNKATNFYLQYILTDENFVQYERSLSTRDQDIASTGQVGSGLYEAYKNHSRYNTEFSPESSDSKFTIVVKPFRGTMVLYNSYGTELLRVESQDNYKTEAAALKNTIRQMRRAIDRNNDKMSIPQKSRCLFCEYNDLKERQKTNVDHIAFIAHRSLLDQLYGEITEPELPRGISPYANIYSSLKDYKTLENIIDTDAVNFDNELGARRLSSHLINELIKTGAPDQLIEKVAAAYGKNDFQELDVNNLTPLWSAISLKDTDLIERLISLGANVNQVTNVDGGYMTPLMLSAQYGNIDTTNVLLANGARKQLTTPNGFSAWSSALWLAQYDHAELLWPDGFIDSNSMEAQNFLTQAAYYGQRDKLASLIENGTSVLARGINGDNAVISAIKGIKTFAIDPDFDVVGDTAHKSSTNSYWDIIDTLETTGFASPLRTSMDSLGQTVLFHAYPDGSNAVKQEHIELISRLIKNGLDQNTTNLNGQNADQAYQHARLTYLDSLYESQLAEINQERRDAARQAQVAQDEAKKVALETLEGQSSFRSRSRAAINAKRLEAIERQDRRARENNFQSQSTSFERDISNTGQTIDSETLMKTIDERIRDNYANDVKLANDMAAQKIDELEEMIDGLKQDEVDNTASRQVKIARMVAEQ